MYNQDPLQGNCHLMPNSIIVKVLHFRNTGDDLQPLWAFVMMFGWGSSWKAQLFKFHLMILQIKSNLNGLPRSFFLANKLKFKLCSPFIFPSFYVWR